MFAPVFGTFVISVSLLVSGCATPRQPMDDQDLDNFLVQCNIKEHQIKFLQSQRMNIHDRRMSGYKNLLNPFTLLTDPNEYYQRQQQAIGRTNWLIDQHLMRLARC